MQPVYPRTNRHLSKSLYVNIQQSKRKRCPAWHFVHNQPEKLKYKRNVTVVRLTLTFSIDVCNVKNQKYMCETCNKIHLNVQTSIKHEIISIRPNQDIQETLTNMVTYNIPCEIHKRKEYIQYCFDCIELVCEACKDKTHRDHQPAKTKTAVMMS